LAQKVIPRIAHGEPPKRIVRRELSCRKADDVVGLAGENLLSLSSTPPLVVCLLGQKMFGRKRF
jgi:hypothetical protein